MKRLQLTLLTGILLCGFQMQTNAICWSAEPAAAKPDATKPTTDKPTAPKLTAAESTFIKTMTNTTLVGQFTVDKKAGEKPNGNLPKAERYEIRSVSKLKDNLWIIRARIKYGKVDTTVPIPVTIEWAGDTPMIMLTDATIPGMGTFSCRVLFYKTRYAGTWQHGKSGGHLWGTLNQKEASKK